MSVSLVVDMNLSAEWIDELAQHGWTAVHWLTIGNRRAEDSTIMAWARANRHVVFTHNLDFGSSGFPVGKFISINTYAGRFGLENHVVSSIGGGYKSRPPQ